VRGGNEPVKINGKDDGRRVWGKGLILESPEEIIMGEVTPFTDSKLSLSSTVDFSRFYTLFSCVKDEFISFSLSSRPRGSVNRRFYERRNKFSVNF
jgi:hypothetical protein